MQSPLPLPLPLFCRGQVLKQPRGTCCRADREYWVSGVSRDCDPAVNHGSSPGVCCRGWGCGRESRSVSLTNDSFVGSCKGYVTVSAVVCGQREQTSGADFEIGLVTLVFWNACHGLCFARTSHCVDEDGHAPLLVVISIASASATDWWRWMIPSPSQTCRKTQMLSVGLSTFPLWWSSRLTWLHHSTV
jgi:hypothetical protein